MEFYVLESKLTEFHGNTVFTKPETVYKRWTLLKKGWKVKVESEVLCNGQQMETLWWLLHLVLMLKDSTNHRLAMSFLRIQSMYLPHFIKWPCYISTVGILPCFPPAWLCSQAHLKMHSFHPKESSDQRTTSSSSLKGKNLRNICRYWKSDVWGALKKLMKYGCCRLFIPYAGSLSL